MTAERKSTPTTTVTLPSIFTLPTHLHHLEQIKEDNEAVEEVGSQLLAPFLAGSRSGQQGVPVTRHCCQSLCPGVKLSAQRSKSLSRWKFSVQVQNSLFRCKNSLCRCQTVSRYHTLHCYTLSHPSSIGSSTISKYY